MSDMEDNVSADEFLAHFGVKGMKWGKHTAGGATGGGGGRIAGAKAGVKKAYENRATTEQIKSARVQDKAAKMDIKAAKKDVRKAGNPADKAKAHAAVEKMKSERLSSDNHRIASKLTTSEKVAVGLLGGDLGKIVVAHNIYKTRQQGD